MWDTGRRGGGGEREGRTERETFSKCVGSVVMGIKCLFALCMISESWEQSFLSRNGTILDELVRRLEGPSTEMHLVSPPPAFHLVKGP